MYCIHLHICTTNNYTSLISQLMPLNRISFSVNLTSLLETSRHSLERLLLWLKKCHCLTAFLLEPLPMTWAYHVWMHPSWANENLCQVTVRRCRQALSRGCHTLLAVNLLRKYQGCILPKGLRHYIDLGKRAISGRNNFWGPDILHESCWHFKISAISSNVEFRVTSEKLSIIWNLVGTIIQF